jgi:hypothetical protein
MQKGRNRTFYETINFGKSYLLSYLLWRFTSLAKV